MAKDSTTHPAMWKGFLQGSIAAMTGGAVSHPLDVIKVRMQIQGEGSGAGTKLNAFQMGPHIFREQGASGLFSGLSASLMRQCVYSGTRFGMYDSIKQSIGGEDKHAKHKHSGSGVLQKIFAAGTAGAIGAFVANPADVCMVRMQADGKLPVDARRNYTNAFNALSRISAEEGVSTLWRGSQATVNRAVVVTIGQMSGYDVVKKELEHHTPLEDGAPLHAISSASAAFLASVLSNPLDVVKTRLMNMQTLANGKPQYSSMFDCLRQTWSSEGALALYKGFGPTLARQLPFVVVTMMTKEQMAKLLKDV